MKNTYLRLISSALALGVAAALSIGATTRTSNPRSSTSATVTDPQIAAIVVAANSVDIEAGKLAQSKTKNRKVREFADDMIRDHTAVNKAAVDLVTKLGVTPEENDTSRGLTSSGEQARALERSEWERV